jgi:hypothetical protein
MSPHYSFSDFRSNISALIQKGIDLHTLGQYEEAIGYYDKVIAAEFG